MRQIRDLMATWVAWQRFNQPADFQPPAWEEADVFNNVLPWTVASAAQGKTEQHLRYKVYCIAQELQRCQEELLFLPQDALNTLLYFQHQHNKLQLAREAALAAEQQASCTMEKGMCRGRAYKLSAWLARVASMQNRAVEAFEKAGWLGRPAGA